MGAWPARKGSSHPAVTERTKKERLLLLALEVGRRAAIRENDRAHQAHEKAALDWLTDG